DPAYAEAYTGLADSVLLLLSNHQAISADEAFDVAEMSLDRALALNPNLADAHASLGLLNFKMWEEARIGSGLEEAEANLISSLELNPNNASAYMWFALVRGAQQRTEEAIELYHKSLRVDPLGKIPYANLPSLYAMRGQNEEALDLYVKAVEIHPDWPTAYQNLGLHLNGLGRIDEAVAWGIKGRELSTDPTRGAPIVMAYVEFGDYDKIAALASGVEPGHPMYEIGHSTLVALRGDPAGAAKIIESALQGVENPRQIHLNLMTTFSAYAGDFEKARRYAERLNPEFAADADPVVDAFNVANLIRYAYILQNLGESQNADTLLVAALDVVRTLPRMGLTGHGIRDVQILALQGKTLEALAALRDAIDEGFRGTVASNGWPIAVDPYLSSLRGQPGFEAMVGELDDAIEVMRQRVSEAEQSGNWDELRALVAVWQSE
ncbi:MAG: tetratricopeptide repeat protein, partial [Gammaproteobacteria bacterium]|nr:tetratricopeptide repeat protein [Gammaproteobacteria bacterium]